MPPSSGLGYTLDTGALIGLERRDRRMLTFYRAATDARLPITVPTVVLVEWWRGQSAHTRRMVLGGVTIEPLDVRLAFLAGQALAQVPGPSLADAVVMASAAQRGDIVLTSDFDDLDRLRAYFPGVRVLGLNRPA
jgi:predicted nucleic acid-binding protein